MFRFNAADCGQRRFMRFRGQQVQNFGSREHMVRMGSDWPLMAIYRQSKCIICTSELTVLGHEVVKPVKIVACNSPIIFLSSSWTGCTVTKTRIFVPFFFTQSVS